ncbi:hypothetical protein B9Z19DRAFT_1075255 [Tuber borchii]|uniref:Uncharacterized protein n=1 Tax=Tuber borchii TaxID=42251 RepID=A0A2T7A3L8_TUBBO|nr:hypothetical protein B9Z19DRAFT_1075255 [Tuber borchii]
MFWLWCGIPWAELGVGLAYLMESKGLERTSDRYSALVCKYWYDAVYEVKASYILASSIIHFRSEPPYASWA